MKKIFQKKDKYRKRRLRYEFNHRPWIGTYEIISIKELLERYG